MLLIRMLEEEQATVVIWLPGGFSETYQLAHELAQIPYFIILKSACLLLQEACITSNLFNYLSLGGCGSQEDNGGEAAVVERV